MSHVGSQVKTRSNDLEDIGQGQRSSHATHHLMLVIICIKYGKNPSRTIDATERTRFSRSRPNDRGVTIRLATIRYISRYTTHDMVHDGIQNQLIYYQWKIWKHCGMCHQYFYIKTVILARNSEFEINKDVHNHPCPKYLLLTNCVCKQNNKIS